MILKIEILDHSTSDQQECEASIIFNSGLEKIEVNAKTPSEALLKLAKTLDRVQDYRERVFFQDKKGE